MCNRKSWLPVARAHPELEVQLENIIGQSFLEGFIKPRGGAFASWVTVDAQRATQDSKLWPQCAQRVALATDRLLDWRGRHPVVESSSPTAGACFDHVYSGLQLS